MNQKRRKELHEASDLLDQCIDMLRNVLSSEEDALDNIPENLQSGEKANIMESIIDTLESAIESLEEGREMIVDIT